MALDHGSLTGSSFSTIGGPICRLGSNYSAHERRDNEAVTAAAAAAAAIGTFNILLVRSFEPDLEYYIRCDRRIERVSREILSCWRVLVVDSYYVFLFMAIPTWVLSTIVLLLFVEVIFYSSRSRTQAVLLYPSGSLFQITLGVSVPVRSNKRGSVVFSSGFQLNFKLPSNISDLEPTVVVARHARDLDLREIYWTIENLFDEHGWGNGRECLLRSICELAETPLLRTGRDVVEEAIHLILTPTEDLAGSVNSTHRSVEEPYREAERLGKSGVDCTLTYPDCIESPLESFTEILFP